MAKHDLSGLMQVVRHQKERQTLNRCGTCKRKDVREAVTRALADIRRNPDKYRGVTQHGLYSWCGAEAAGIRYDAWRKCLIAHHPGALDIFAAAR